VARSNVPNASQPRRGSRTTWPAGGRWKLLRGITVEPMEIRAVSRDVNKVGNNSADLLTPVSDEADRPLELALPG
jgi:hypothetical protein